MHVDRITIQLISTQEIPYFFLIRSIIYNLLSIRIIVAAIINFLLQSYPAWNYKYVLYEDLLMHNEINQYPHVQATSFLREVF